MLFYVITVLVIIGIAGMCMAFFYDEDKVNTDFLKEYGWEVRGECIECEIVDIPDIFDEVYNNYNELQKLAGLDLCRYKGKRILRYTYIVSNFPGSGEKDEIRANVLCCDEKPIGGDIMTVRSDGFMYSLNYLKIKK